MKLRYLFDIFCVLAIGLCIGSLPGCEFTDGNQDVVIGHKLPPVHNHVKVEVDAHLRRDRTDPHHCSCCSGARCLCGKNCTCRCER